MTKKQLFMHLVSKGIYLNIYYLKLAYNQYLESKNKIKELVQLEEDYGCYEFKSKEAKLKAAYAINTEKREKFLKKVSKPVLQICKETGNVIEEFSSIYKAAVTVGNRNSFPSISNVCNGKQNSAIGFKWRFK